MLEQVLGLWLFATIVNYSIALKRYRHRSHWNLHWNWDAINTTTLNFPRSFEFGVATSEYQLSGCEWENHREDKIITFDSNWSRYEKKKNLFGNPIIEPVGKGIDHWNRYNNDIDLIKELGVTLYRCSIAWERIQTREHYFDPEALEHYHKLFDECRAANLKLMVTLHHFVSPGWFEDKGGFEKEENNRYFVEFAQRMFLEYGDKVAYWCTINEPGVFAAQSYITHSFPRPKNSSFNRFFSFFKIPHFYGAGTVTKNLLCAHIATYSAIKSMIGGDKAKIGLAHQVVPFEPYHAGNPIEKAVTYVFNHVYHAAITQFLKTGEFCFKTLTRPITLSYPKIREMQDFVGINYYSHALFKWSHPTRPQFRTEDKEIRTDMCYGIYAEGLYRVIKDMNIQGKPIFITESGIADAQDDRRELWYRRYLFAISKAINEGANVRVFCTWSAFDSFEWDWGYTKKFGLYQVNISDYNRRLRSGAEYFKNVAQYHADSF